MEIVNCWARLSRSSFTTRLSIPRPALPLRSPWMIEMERELRSFYRFLLPNGRQHKPKVPMVDDEPAIRLALRTKFGTRGLHRRLFATFGALTASLGRRRPNLMPAKY